MRRVSRSSSSGGRSTCRPTTPRCRSPTCVSAPMPCSARIDRGLELAQHFVHENRIRQAASSLGAAQFCINEAVAYANDRVTWGKKLSTNQAIQFPLVELHTEAAMLRQLVRYTAWMLDHKHHMEVTHLVAMCNYRANRLACDAADRAMQTCGGVGLLAAHAVRAHLPAPPPLPHHRRLGGDPDAQGRPATVRLRPRQPLALGRPTRQRQHKQRQSVIALTLRRARCGSDRESNLVPRSAAQLCTEAAEIHREPYAFMRSMSRRSWSRVRCQR